VHGASLLYNRLQGEDLPLWAVEAIQKGGWSADKAVVAESVTDPSQPHPCVVSLLAVDGVDPGDLALPMINSFDITAGTARPDVRAGRDVLVADIVNQELITAVTATMAVTIGCRRAEDTAELLGRLP
jgi:hypothetical protein